MGRRARVISPRAFTRLVSILLVCVLNACELREISLATKEPQNIADGSREAIESTMLLPTLLPRLVNIRCDTDQMGSTNVFGI